MVMEHNDAHSRAVLARQLSSTVGMKGMAVDLGEKCHLLEQSGTKVCSCAVE